MMNTSPFNPGRVNMAVVKDFTTTLFAGWDWRQGGVIALRGIGEKGTDKDGRFREPKFIDPRNVFGFSQIETHLTRWGDNGIAAFILPGIVKADAADDGHATDDRIHAFTAIALDIDSGNVAEKLEHCRDWIGEPTMIVLSGGVTDLGHNKVHAYWCLTQPTLKVKDIGRIRKILAAKVGGDLSFGRIAQVIRIPGSIYGKGGVAKPVELVSKSGPRYDLADLVDAIESMEWMEGCLPAMDLPVMSSGGMMDFSAGATLYQRALDRILTEPVHEGGADGVTRWDNFNAVAGHHIHCIRTGAESEEEAREAAWGWVLASMVPPWPRARFESEWQGLLNKDVREKGPVETQAVQIDVPQALVERAKIEPLQTKADLLSWAVHKRSTLDPKPRVDLVEGIVAAGLRHILVSEGGAGKTFLMMDLMLKLAAAREGGPTYKWLGRPITPDAIGGTVVMFTAEDNQDSLDRRWKQIDPDMSMRLAAGDRLIVIPLDNVGGSFPLLTKNPHTGELQPSEQWRMIVQALVDMIQDGHRITCVGLDTVNASIHGDENSAEVIAQYMRALTPITGLIGAALVMNHHVRKLKDDKPIDGPERMLEAIRGSAALKDNVRVAIGIWHAPDWAEQLDLMGLPVVPKRLYKAAIVKSNDPMMEGERYLMRTPGGLLEECDRAVQNAQRTSDMRAAWLLFCITHYADQDFYFTLTGRESGLFKQISKLHECLQMARAPLLGMAEKLLKGRNAPLMKVRVTGKGSEAQWLDVRGRHKGERLWIEAEAEIKEPDWDAYEYDPAVGKIVPKEGV